MILFLEDEILNESSCELLAPAGNMDILKAAIYSGADSVYISGEKYGARFFADNFNYNQLKEAVNFAHESNVKIYVTVNTLILESEMADVVDYVFYLYNIGVDGVIIQDIGLAMVIHRLIPNLELHASTQMTIYDYPFVRWLADNGFSNVNISREVPLERIKKIIDNKNRFNHDVKVEVFGHGAICYCYSGRCLASSFAGGRSGNRGLCAQPCRMRYTFEDSYNTKICDSNYLLSTKDLCLYNDLDQIIDSGVDAIKIEGRIKSADYVSAVTYAYSEALKGSKENNFLLLNLAFNRGLTSGYIMDNIPSKVVSRIRSGSQGYPIGRVINASQKEVTIQFLDRRYPAKIVNGDGLKFQKDDDSCGMYVSRVINQSRRKVTISKSYKKSIEEGAMVYITYSKYLKDITTGIINQKMTSKIGLELDINLNNKGVLEVNCSCDLLDEKVKVTSDKPLEIAKNKPLTKDTIIKQMSKSGNTRFSIDKVNIKTFQDNLFIPLSKLNSIRRSLLEKVDELINKKSIPNDTQEVKNNIKSFKREYYEKNDRKNNQNLTWKTTIDSLEQAEVVADFDYVEYVQFDSSQKYDDINSYMKDAYDSLVALHDILPDKKIVWTLPSLLLEEDIPDVSEILLKLEIDGIDVIIQTDDIGVASQLDCDCFMSNPNVYNNYTIEKLTEDPGFKQVAVSNEISIEDINRLNRGYNDLELKVFGNMEIMITKDDFKDLKLEGDYNRNYLVDKRYNRYKVVADCYNQSHIYDYRILNLAGHINKIKDSPISTTTIDLRLFNVKDSQKILNYFEDAINQKIGDIELEYRQFFECNFTRGLYIEE